MLYNVVNKKGSRVATIDSPRVDKSTCNNYAASGLFIQVCDERVVITHGLPRLTNQYILGAGIAIGMQAIMLMLIL
jgi:hypothetical protein